MKEGWKYVKFENCLVKVPKQPQIKSKDYKDFGLYPVVSQETGIINGYCDDKNCVYRHSKPIVIFGDHTKNIKYIDFDFVVGADGTHILLPNDEFNSKFFYYSLKSIRLRNLGYARHYKLLKEKEIPLPPLSEQEDIVTRLDSSFAKIDAVKANAKRELDEAKALFQSALSERMKPKEGWEEKKLGEVGAFKRGGNFSKNDFQKSGFPCIHYGQIHTKFGIRTIENLTFVKDEIVKKDKCAKHGDLVIAITSEDNEGSCKCTAWMGNYDVYVGAHAAIFSHSCHPIFMSYYFLSPLFQKEKLNYTHGFKVVEINPKDIAKIPIPLPPLSEQESIVSRLDAISEKVKKIEACYNTTVRECDALKQAILKEIFE